MSRLTARLAALAAIALLSTAASRATELIMFERAGCVWCARFDAEIAPIYGKTEEGRAAPLRRVDLKGPVPADLARIDPGAFTPTFVVVKEGREIGRIRGYPGDAFFFGLLDRILTSSESAPGRS
ncbi:thioredoxin [Bradyrhizobium erythrophlei]|uniref:thioredoxin n=1 Tax=Bradyrhizobium erythrophlei TaxID=1437360 RepID=UPI0035E82318